MLQNYLEQDIQGIYYITYAMYNILLLLLYLSKLYNEDTQHLSPLQRVQGQENHQLCVWIILVLYGCMVVANILVQVSGRVCVNIN